ncbi:MAG: dimethylargininase, partial [Bryobacteraceae bacterium]
MLTALVREVSRSLAGCDLQHLARTPIDVEKAAAQHTLYCERLAAMGATILTLPALDDLPDAVFVE